MVALTIDWSRWCAWSISGGNPVGVGGISPDSLAIAMLADAAAPRHCCRLGAGADLLAEDAVSAAAAGLCCRHDRFCAVEAESWEEAPPLLGNWLACFFLAVEALFLPEAFLAACCSSSASNSSTGDKPELLACTVQRQEDSACTG